MKDERLAPTIIVIRHNDAPMERKEDVVVNAPIDV